MIKINVNSVGRGTIMLDDQDISDRIRSFSVNGGVGEDTQIVLELIPEAVQIEADGIIYIPSAEGIKKFLETIDPEVVKAEAFAALGWNDDDPVTKAIQYIKHMGDNL